jgi:hypothetical protein
MLLALLLAAQLHHPVQLASQAVQRWLSGGMTPHLHQILQAQTPQEALRELKDYLAFSPPPPGLKVNFGAPQVTSTTTGTIVSFPAVSQGQGGFVTVSLQGNQITGIAWSPQGGLFPSWLEGPWSWILFAAFSIAWIFSLLTPSGFRRLWKEGWAVVRRYWKLYVAVNIGLYGVYILGSALAAANPYIAREVQQIAASAVDQIGLGGSNGLPQSVPSLALLIFYWNFSHGLVLTTAIPALFLGLPALLLNLLRYFVFGFALSPAILPARAFLVHIPTLIIELQAYILGTFGGMVLFLQVIRGQGYRRGLWALSLSVYLGITFLLLGAWYESFELLKLLPFLRA